MDKNAVWAAQSQAGKVSKFRGRANFKLR